MKDLYLLVVFGVFCCLAKAQNPIADFSMPSSACLNQNVFIQNLSMNAVKYEWDFCQGDISLSPSGGAITSIGGVTIEDLDIVFDGINWFGFAVSRDNNSIIRLDFGSDINSTPILYNLGNISSVLFNPTGIKIVSESDHWYGFVHNYGGNHIVRIDFGSSLSNIPSGQVLLSGPGVSDGGLDIVNDSGIWYILYSGFNSAGILRLNTLATTPTNSDNLTFSVGGASYLAGCSLLKQGGNWFGFFITNQGYNSIQKLSFGSNIFSIPSVQNISGSILSGYNPYGLDVVFDAGEYHMFITTLSGDLLKVNLGADLSSAPGANTSLGNLSILSNTLKLRLVNWQSNWLGFTFNYSSTELYKITFPSPACGITPQYYQGTPQVLKYTMPGNKIVGLKALNSNYEFDEISKSITIASIPSPDIDFSFTANTCTNVSMNFTSQNVSGDIASYSWNFGDNTNSSTPNPSHPYAAAAIYYPSLNVTSTNGCQNSVQDTLQIFNIPQANFTLPNTSPFCTNQNYTYTNTSTYDNGSNPVWQWTVNGTNVGTTKDLNYLFTSSSAQTISLTVSIPGCSTQSTQDITSLAAGPLVSFSSPSTGCKGSSIAFTNTTTDPITSYSWSFGDGNTSSQFNSSNTYTSTGIYTATLNAANASGCQNFFSKDISIYSVPQPDFVIEAPPLSCERSPSQLDNLTPALVDSNISSWSWSFGDANNGTSTLKNPTYTYASAGSYNVLLRATSNFGCSKSIQKSVSISPSPVANFTNTAACVNQGARFTDASSGSVSFYQWTIQNNILSGSTPSYTFRSSGTFPVTLTITSNNGCTNQITKNIIVPVLPVIDFTVQAPCTGHPSVFSETNPNTADPAVAWNWNFGQASGTGSPVSYQFASEGGHTVTMSTTRQSGCVYSTSENISISAGPIASFTPSTFAGAAPLNVVFTNTSIADTYLWSFGDQAQTTSTTASPAFTYNTLGKYKALLTAKNNLGCSDTLSTEIYVVIPHVDVAMNGLSLTNDLTSNTSKPVVTIFNSGNMPLIDPVVVFDLGGGALVKEKVSGMLRPGKSLSQTLGLQIIPGSIKYLCAEIDAANDANLYNNRQCVSLSHENMVMAPYPNPATSGHVTLEWIGVSQENATITIFRSNGEIVFEQRLDQVQAGLGQLDISTSSMSNGLYLVRFVGSTVTKTFRIVIAN